MLWAGNVTKSWDPNLGHLFSYWPYHSCGTLHLVLRNDPQLGMIYWRFLSILWFSPAISWEASCDPQENWPGNLIIVFWELVTPFCRNAKGNKFVKCHRKLFPLTLGGWGIELEVCNLAEWPIAQSYVYEIYGHIHVSKSISQSINQFINLPLTHKHTKRLILGS